MMRSVITGTGMYIPEASVDNDALSRVMETSDEWIQVRTGIAKRQYAAPNQATSDLAVPACHKAIENAGLKPEDIDYVIVAPDYFFPGSAPFLQRKLGLEHVPCLDIRQQCAGFVYALQLADALIRSGQYRKVLVVGAETHASLLPWNNATWRVALGEDEGPVSKEDYEKNTMSRDRVVLFGDGAGAVVVEAREDGNSGVEVVYGHRLGRSPWRWDTAFRIFNLEKQNYAADLDPFTGELYLSTQGTRILSPSPESTSTCSSLSASINSSPSRLLNWDRSIPCSDKCSLAFEGISVVSLMPVRISWMGTRILPLNRIDV